ncbi:hypothetical protein ILYODFUR_026225 [Ilyodon furcidens]|uniref:Uncharacterized protein n=1 Tax=Ilyodon furcidens TaxID=33524 RepID=A0ABV0TZ03_9TELE
MQGCRGAGAYLPQSFGEIQGTPWTGHQSITELCTFTPTGILCLFSIHGSSTTGLHSNRSRSTPHESCCVSIDLLTAVKPRHQPSTSCVVPQLTLTCLMAQCEPTKHEISFKYKHANKHSLLHIMSSKGDFEPLPWLAV